MPEQSNQPDPAKVAATEAAAAAPAPLKLQAKINGKVEEVDLSKPENLATVQRYYQIGKADELRRDRIVQMQQEMKAKEPLLKVASELSDFYGRNPAGGRAFMEMYQALREGRATPEQVMAVVNGHVQQQTNQSREEEAGAHTRAGVDAETKAMLANLESRLNGVAAQMEQRERATAQRDRLTEVDAALGRDEFLKSRPETQALVRDQILARIDAGMSLEEATSLESQRIRNILSESVTAERDKRMENREAMRTAPPTAGVPPTRDFLPKMPDRNKSGSPDAYMKGAWKSTREGVRDFARAAMRAMAQGPNQ